MSVANEFECCTIQINEQERKLYMLGIDNGRYEFKYDIKCVADVGMKVNLFFSLSSSKCLIVYKDSGFFKCVIMKFWIEDDSPVLGIRYFSTDSVMTMIDEQFKDQYASFVIDDAINS